MLGYVNSVVKVRILDLALKSASREGREPRQPALTGNGGKTMRPAQGSSRSPALSDACASEGFFMISRRSFLIGLGSLVTSAFVARAEAYALEYGTPLLLDSPP